MAEAKRALLIVDAQEEYFAPHGKWVLPDGPKASGRSNGSWPGPVRQGRR